MKLRELILKHFGLPQEKLGDIIINRCGGWLDDTVNPAVWPGNNGLDLDVFNPDVPSQRTKIYVEFAIRSNGTIPAWARLEFDNAQIVALEQQP